MIKLLAISATLLAHVAYSETETILVRVYDVNSMYNDQCVTSTSTSTSAAPESSSDTSKDESSSEHSHDKYYKKYGQKYADKYGGSYEGGSSSHSGDSKWSKWSDKYQHEYQGASNPGSVKGNEVGGDSYESADEKETATFCKCLEKVKEKGKSYAASQDDISRCIDEANGNDAKHWEDVAKRYEHKYGIKTDSWDGPMGTTAVGSSSSSDDDMMAAGAVAGIAGNVNALVAGADMGDDDQALLSKDDGRFGNAAVYITFIGTSVLLFVCAWFIKDGLKKWQLREYQHVKQGSSYESEADAECHGNPYGDDWDDQYDSNYRGNDASAKKNRFASWNQYHAV